MDRIDSVFPELGPGLRHLDEAAAVFGAMLTGWSRQQASRGLADNTIVPRLRLMRRFSAYLDSYPWDWSPADLEDYTSFRISQDRRPAYSTIRGEHLVIRQFCDYVGDQRYGWGDECEERFGTVPTQICHEWNTTVHLGDFEARPGRRPLDYSELQVLFDYADSRVEVAATSGRKGALAALRDAQMIKTTYAFGLRRREITGLDVFDLRPNPKAAMWGNYGGVQVRWGKSSKGGPPSRRTVLLVPEFHWVVPGLAQWVDQGREIIASPEDQALWLTERGTRVSPRYLDIRFRQLREECGLPVELTLHSLRHSYVTHLIEFGYAERFVQDQVGHAYASTTALYTSVSDDYRTRILDESLSKFYTVIENEMEV